MLPFVSDFRIFQFNFHFIFLAEKTTDISDKKDTSENMEIDCIYSIMSSE